VKLPRTLGRYEVIEAIGTGSTGALYRARDPRIGREVAIKLVREGTDNPDIRNRFAREARSAGRLSHPNIVTVYDIGTHDGLPFIAMEYVPGRTFADLIRERAPLALARKLQMMEEVCAGLAHAHEAGIVHRDIRPANLIVGRDGIVKILDFGIAKLLDSGLTQPGVMLGAMNYMAPEQITGVAVDRRSDVFAAGAVLYELLSYEQAFPGGLQTAVLGHILNGAPVPLREHCPDLDPALVRIVEQALEKDPARRFQSAEELQEALAAVRLGASDLAAGAEEPASVEQPTVLMTSVRLSDRTIGSGGASAAAGPDADALAAAERACEAGDLNRAIAACEEVLRVDPSESRALALLDRLHAVADDRQVSGWIAEAGDHLSRGEVGAAADLAAAAAADGHDRPALAELCAQLEAARAAIRREAAAWFDARARAAAAVEDVALALALAGGARELDPDFAAAHTLAANLERAAAAAEDEAAVREAVADARRRFLDGDEQGAIRLMDAMASTHALAARAAEDLRVVLDARARARPAPAAGGAPALADAPTVLASAVDLDALTGAASPLPLGARDLDRAAAPVPTTARADAVRAADAISLAPPAAGPPVEVSVGARSERPQRAPTAPPALQRPVVWMAAAAALLVLVLGGLWARSRPAATQVARPAVPPPAAARAEAPPAAAAVPAPGDRPQPAPPQEPAAPAATYTVTIVGEYSFTVEYPGGRRPAAARQRLTLPAGRTTEVRLTNPAVFLDAAVPIRGEPDESKSIKAPALSSITVYNSWNESCEIAIDDRVVGYHPVTQQLVAGPHEVSLKCKDGRAPRPQRVNVPATHGALVTFTKNE